MNEARSSSALKHTAIGLCSSKKTISNVDGFTPGLPEPPRYYTLYIYTAHTHSGERGAHERERGSEQRSRREERKYEST